jgi:hypothetical protein
MSDADRKDSKFIGIDCQQRQVLARHVFTAFLWAIADCIKETEIWRKASCLSRPCTYQQHQINFSSLRYGIEALGDQTIPPRYTSDFPKLENSKIQELADALVSAELGTSGEIYQSIIPPLSDAGVLPTFALVDFYHDRILECEEKSY